MIGILCEKNKKIIYSKKIDKLIKSYFNEKTDSFIVFSALDLDLRHKTVDGILISCHKRQRCTMPMPNVIYNFLDSEKGLKRKLWALRGQTDITVTNRVNHFNQVMIMEMLASSETTKRFVLSYSDSSSLEAKDNPTVFTLHTVRNAANEWTVLPLSVSPAGLDDDGSPSLYKAAFEIARCVANFISSLAFCTITLALDDNHSPFLIDFSGWDSSLLLKKQTPDLLNLFSVCFQGYSHLLLNAKEEKPCGLKYHL
jgi:hypothetical protein